MAQNTKHHIVRRVAAILSAAFVASCGSSGGDSSTPVVPVGDGPLTATLGASAADPDGDALTYEWKVTAGSLSSPTGSTVKWTVPEGGGVQFAYLTVSDSRGAYVEKTLALELGAPTGPRVVPDPRNSLYPVSVRDTFEGAPLRMAFSVDRPFGPTSALRSVYVPAETVALTYTGTTGANAQFKDVSISGLSDDYGEVKFPKLPSGQWSISCNRFAQLDCAHSGVDITGQALTLRDLAPSDPNELRLYGHISLADGSLCGISSPYKHKHVGATIEFRGETFSANAYGDYALRIVSGDILTPSTMKFKCEGTELQMAVPIERLNASPDATAEVSVSLQNRAPVVAEIQATASGLAVGQAITETGAAASLQMPRTDHFLTFKGFDTADSACAYYLSIGATPSCGANGKLPDSALRFDEWKRMRKLAPYDGDAHEVHVTYLNQVDLNLVRDMHAIRGSTTDYAFYVCNYPKPASNSSMDIDAAIANAKAGKNLVACVAMDYSVTDGTNLNSTLAAYRPFTKFYVFGPDGALISSVNLDGRGEKFVPGSCVVCHGGSKYAGQFPTTTFPVSFDANGPSGDLGARFLPFDVGNYQFSTTDPGLTGQLQQLGIKRLNFYIRDIERDFSFVPPSKAGPPPAPEPTATIALIEGWYAGSLDPEIPSFSDTSYVPPAWQPGGTAAGASNTSQAFYGQVISRYCRTCHTALPNFNWDADFPGLAYSYKICGGGASIGTNAAMANSKQTFDLFWEAVRTNSTTRELVGEHLGCKSGGVSYFAPAPDPLGASH